MTLTSHLAQLERRHEALEKEIEKEKVRPSLDELKLLELKRKKLHLKDEITRLQKTGAPPTMH